MNLSRHHPLHHRCLVALACAALALGAAAQGGTGSQFYEDALQRFEKKDYAGTIIQLRNALRVDKNQLAVHLLLGKALLADSNVGAAEVAFKDALRLGVNRAEVVVPLARAVIAQGKQQQLVDDPVFALAGLPNKAQSQLLLLRAAAQADLGDARASMKAIDEARALEPSAAEPWLAEVPVRIRARQTKEALAAADRALALAPRLPEALYSRGTVLHATGDLKGALAAYDKALQADPTHGEALVSRAGLLVDLGRPADARRDIGALRKIAPKDPRGAYLQALLDEREGNAASAKAALNEVTALLDPVPMEYFRFRPQVLMLGGLAHYGLNQKEKAKPYLEAVQRNQPGSPVSKLLAQIYLSEKNVDRAIESLELYLRGQPADSQAVLLLASAHFSQGRHARAAKLMSDALKVNDAPELHAMLGISLMGGGKIADAAKELEAAFNKDPNQLQAGMALASIQLRNGQPSKAVATASRMARQQPAHAGVQNLLGAALAGKGDVAGALAAFEAALKIDPAFVAPQLQLARLDMRANRMEAAAARLNAVLAKDERNTEALSEMAVFYERLGKLADAQRSLEKAADQSAAADLQPALALVDFHLRHGQPAAARDAGKRLAEKAPGSLQVLIVLSRVALANGDTEGAKANLNRASRMADYQPALLLQIATMQLAAGHPQEAAYSLDKALGERPDYLPAQALMAEVEIKRGDTAKAEARAKQLVAQQPKAGVGHSLLGDIALMRGQAPAAIDHYRRAHAIDRSSASLQRLFRLQVATDPAAAIQLAEQWLRQRPDDQPVRRDLADAHARAGNLAAARATYEALLKGTPTDADSLNNLANVLLLQNDPAALAVAERALAQRPGAAHIIGTTGWAAFKAGQTDRSLQLLRDARLRDPGNPETRYFLAEALAATGKTAEAREELRAALAAAPEFPSRKLVEQRLATLK